MPGPNNPKSAFSNRYFAHSAAAKKAIEESDETQAVIELNQAIGHLDFSLPDHRKKAAKIRLQLANCYFALKNYPALQCAATRSRLGLQTQDGCDADKIEAMKNQGLASWFMPGGPMVALRYFQEAYDLARSSDCASQLQLVKSMDNLALALHETGRNKEAIELQKQALAFAKKNGTQDEIARISRRLANLYADNDFLILANELLETVRPTDLTSVTDTVAWFSSAAQLAQKHNFIEAKSHYESALEMYKLMPIALRASMASLLSNAALFFLDLGLHMKADQILGTYKQLSPELQTLNARLGLTRLTAQMAYETGEPEEAEKIWHRACQLILTDGGGNPQKLADIQTTRSRLLWEMNQQNAALELLEPYSGHTQNHHAGEIGFQSQPSICLAQFLLDRHQNTKAYPILFAAFQALNKTHSPDLYWRLLSALSDLASQQEHPHSSILFAKLATRSICKLTRPFNGSKKERNALLRSRTLPFENLIDRLAEQARYSEARHILAMSKTDLIMEFARRDTHLDNSPDETPFRHDELEVVENLDDNHIAAICEYTNALDWKKSTRERARARSLLDILDLEAQDLFENLLAEKWVSQKKSPITDTATEPPNDRTAILSFLTGNQAVHVHAITASGEAKYTLSCQPTKLSHLIFQLRLAIETQSLDFPHLSQKLYKLLMAPIENLLVGIDRIEILARGALSCLPFACLLNNANRYLVEDFSLAYHTGIQQNSPVKQTATIRRIAAFGFAAGDKQNTPLTHVAEELATIKSLQPDTSIYMDGDFTLDNLKKELSSNTSLLHIASHYHLVPGASHFSSLLLGNGSQLVLSELSREQYDFSGLELLVLSGCDTATAEHGMSGVESLAGLAHMKGARHVIGTLWKIADAGAAALMQSFYQVYFLPEPELDAADCLREAQLSLIYGAEISPEIDRTQRGFGQTDKSFRSLSHPFFWAGYSLFASGN